MRCAALLCLLLPSLASGYSVLTHEAVIDTLWDSAIKPALLARFPQATPDQLREAHAYAYGGCIIQDLGYYPLGNHFFTDLVHYVRSADFVESLIHESNNLDEYAFALGALAHYGADTQGHPIAVNRAVPVLYPKLRRKFGNVMTYEENPAAHVKTEFGFDVLQVARGHYAPDAYRDFIGFQVSKDLLERAFEHTYGLRVIDLFHAFDLSLGTFRFFVSNMIPKATRVAWVLKSKEIEQQQPGITRKRFLYNISRASYRKQWGSTYRRPGFWARVAAFFFRLIPPVGPFRALGFKLPTAPTEALFESSFDATVRHDEDFYKQVRNGHLAIPNLDFDTGKPVSPGEYKLTDQAYEKLLEMLADKKFDRVTPELRANILDFFSRKTTPNASDLTSRLEALKQYTPAAAR